MDEEAHGNNFMNEPKLSTVFIVFNTRYPTVWLTVQAMKFDTEGHSQLTATTGWEEGCHTQLISTTEQVGGEERTQLSKYHRTD